MTLNRGNAKPHKEGDPFSDTRDSASSSLKENEIGIVERRQASLLPIECCMTD